MAGGITVNEEYHEAINNLEKANWEVDYVITHTAGDNILHRLSAMYRHDDFTRFLFRLEQNLEYKHWYFGHFHEDWEVDEKHTLLYQDVIEIGMGLS